MVFTTDSELYPVMDKSLPQKGKLSSQCIILPRTVVCGADMEGCGVVPQCLGGPRNDTLGHNDDESSIPFGKLFF